MLSAYLIPGLDVGPPVQENLDGPEVAFSSSTVEGRLPSVLSETQKNNTLKQFSWNTITTHTTTHT